MDKKTEYPETFEFPDVKMKDGTTFKIIDPGVYPPEHTTAMEESITRMSVAGVVFIVGGVVLGVITGHDAIKLGGVVAGFTAVLGAIITNAAKEHHDPNRDSAPLYLGEK